MNSLKLNLDGVRSCPLCGRFFLFTVQRPCLICQKKLLKTSKAKEFALGKAFYARAAFNIKEPLVHQWIYSLKSGVLHTGMYRQAALQLLPLMGDLTGFQVWPKISLIAPVPSHGGGPDHAYFLAQSIAEELSLPFGPLFVNPNSEKQRQKGKGQRSQIRIELAEGAQQRLRDFGLPSLNILLIDDVITTGATMRACATALGEIANFTGLCLAYTPKETVPKG